MFELGKSLKNARKSKNLTQQELANLVGCSLRHISSIESGTKLPSPALWETLVNALNLNMDIEALKEVSSESLFKDGLLKDVIQASKFLTPGDVALIRNLLKVLSDKNKSLPL